MNGTTVYRPNKFIEVRMDYVDKDFKNGFKEDIAKTYRSKIFK